MKNHQTAIRIIAGVLPAMALFATPALAQETAAPPVVPVQPAPPPVATAPVAEAPVAAPAQAAPDQSKFQASLDAATGKTASADDAAPVAAARPARAAARPAARPAPRAAARAAPVAAAPAAVAPTPVTPVPEAAPSAAPVEAAAPPAAEPAAPVADTPVATDTTTTTEATGTPSWLWLVAGLAGLAVIVFGIMALRRRRTDDAYVEERIEDQPVATAYAEPAIAAPVADETIVAQADVTEPEAADIAAMTEASAPVAGRPWIELSLRPIRAGATDESAMVDLELTLANAGAETAKNVRVSTFMLGDATDAPTDMERLLATGHHGADVDAGSIAAGEGSRIDARLAVPREGMDGSTFQPLVGVDVRYTLPNGTEGRTAAAFTVGVHDDTEDPTPIRLGGDMREDVSATLHGVPERV